jgi:hypothetical protein
MLGTVLILSGLFAITYGASRGYVAARSSLLPLVRDGDPTRTLIEATRPRYARMRVRTAARRVLEAMLWLVVAMYGLYLASVGLTVLG